MTTVEPEAPSRRKPLDPTYIEVPLVEVTEPMVIALTDAPVPRVIVFVPAPSAR